MKILKSILYTGLVGVLSLTACEKKLEVKKVNFEVTTLKNSYQVGDPVTFNFSGNPDNITFFSGEVGHKYEYRSRLKAEGKPSLEFTSYMQYGVQDIPLQLLASTTFNGKVDQDVASGGWIDITDKATFSSGSDNTPSGSVDLSQFVADKPVYIAFHYKGDGGSVQRKWTIKDLQVTNKLTSGNTLSIADLSNAAFSQVSLSNESVVWKIDANQLSIQGGPATNGTNDDWVVSRALDLNSVSPDAGEALKNITTVLNNYTYIFTEPGTYKVTFLASNITVDQSDSVIKELTVTVTP